MAKRSPASHADVGAFDTAEWFFDNGLEIFMVLRGAIVEQVNPAWAAVTGWSVEESLGSPLDRFSHPENVAAVLAATTRVESHGFAETDVRIRTKDDRWLWMSWRARVNDNGLTMAVLRDITEQRQRETEDEQQRDAKAMLREVAGVMIWRFDPERNVYLVDDHLNRRGESDSFGPRELTRQEVDAQMHAEDVPKVMAAFMDVVETGQTRVYDYRHLGDSNAWIYSKATIRGLRRLPSGNWEVLGITQDVTELAIARDLAIRGELAAKEGAESKSHFLANMSHEIRTPLNGVLGVLHLLKSETLSADGFGLLTEAVNCGSMLAKLLNDILDFSKIEAGCLLLQSEPVEVEAVIAGVAAIMRPQVEAKGLDLVIDVGSGEGWVLTDPVRLRQMLFNLIGNAVKFTVAGSVSIRLASSGEDETRRLRIEVADTGMGISANTQAALFTRFHQADGSATRGFEGTGLGLAITRHLAELMGGEVGVESEEGEGSRFWIDIPAPHIDPPAAADSEDRPWLQGLRVLVVEDNATNRLIATKILANLGAVVETAENGAIGVEAAARSNFDLIFMDVQMPVMDGVAATLAIRALPAPACEAPIIAMTANVMAQQVLVYRQAGMNGVIAKPISPSAIIAEISHLAHSAEGPEAARATAA